MPVQPSSCFFIVDDDVVCRNVYTHILKNLGYNNIHLLDNGSDCFILLDEIKPDIVFLDYNMNDPDGIDILKQIRKFDPAIAIVFISGEENIEVAVKTMHPGAIDYIVKSPLDIERMKAVLQRIDNMPAPGEIAATRTKSIFKRLFS